MISFGALVAACGDGDDDNGGSSSNAGSAASPTAAAAVAQEVTLRAGERGQEFYYSTKEIRVKPGEIKLTLFNDGPERPHTFNVKNLSGQGELVNSDRINPGQSGSVTFKITAGTYEFFCILPTHADRGQKGSLIVAN
jgi:uncharacterized cupredoxin-like copper-binding protein